MSDGLVLLVDDNEDNRTIYSVILRHYGLEVVLAADGAEALRQAVTHRPDVVLMDIALPGIDGFEATRRIRATELLGETPVLALTAMDTRICPEDLRRGGFCGWLTKPVPPATVYHEVVRILRGRAALPEAAQNESSRLPETSG